METLTLAVETASWNALIHLRDLIPQMVDELNTHLLPYRKDEICTTWTLVPSKEDGTPLMFQTYFNLSTDSLANNLIMDSVNLRKELNNACDLLRQTKTKLDGINKDGAPKGRPTIAYRGGVPPSRHAPTCRHCMSAMEYRAIFTDPPVKHRQDGPPRPPTL